MTLAMSYVDGFVLAVPKKNLSVYKRVAKGCGKIWLAHGALSYVECVADDVKPGKHTSFPQSVKAKQDEVVVFSWITFASRKDRDRVNKAVMADPKMAKLSAQLGKDTFDAKRMIYGGFKTMMMLGE